MHWDYFSNILGHSKQLVIDIAYKMTYLALFHSFRELWPICSYCGFKIPKIKPFLITKKNNCSGEKVKILTCGSYMYVWWRQAVWKPWSWHTIVYPWQCKFAKTLSVKPWDEYLHVTNGDAVVDQIHSLGLIWKQTLSPKICRDPGECILRTLDCLLSP